VAHRLRHDAEGRVVQGMAVCERLAEGQEQGSGAGDAVQKGSVAKPNHRLQRMPSGLRRHRSVRSRHDQSAKRHTQWTYAETMCEDRRSRRSYRNIYGTCIGCRLLKVCMRETWRVCASLTSPCGPFGMLAS
jgi:hypothetical protein